MKAATGGTRSSPTAREVVLELERQGGAWVGRRDIVLPEELVAEKGGKCHTGG